MFSFSLSGGNIQSWREEQKIQGQEGKVKEKTPTWNIWGLATGFGLIKYMENSYNSDVYG